MELLATDVLSLSHRMGTSVKLASRPAPGLVRERERIYELAQILLVVAFIAALYFDVIAGLASDWWNDPSASHGMLVPPLALYVAWLNRRPLLALEARPDGRGLLLFAFGCFLFLLGRLGAEFFLMRVSLVFLLAGLVWVFWGIRRLQKLSFPLVLLATMVPLPVLVYNALAAPLQLFASDIATQVARWFGVTVHQDGNIIHLASVSLGVAEACSGLRSLSSLAVAALLLGFLYCTGLIARALLFLLSVPLSIAVNVVRVSGTALLADHNPEWALGFYHSFSGWAVFMIGFAALYAISKLAHYIFDVKRTA